jgi:hypothetical protein
MGKLYAAGFLSVALLIWFAFVKTGVNSADISKNRIYGAIAEIGNGNIESYAEVDAEGVPQAIGIIFSKASLENLPTDMSDGNRCADLNNDDVIDIESECLMWHERVIPLPSEISRRSDMPFKWVLMNWNPHGHMPEGVYNTPHFDVHFYIESIEKVFSLMAGPCGPEKMRCDQYEIATKPVPANYIHPDFQDVGAAAPAMGNHLIDPTGPEFNGEPFTRSWIFGANDGRITFWEEMLTLDYLLSEPNKCHPIKTPSSVELSGYYPTTVCTVFNPKDSSVAVSLEEFVYRNAESPVSSE